MEKRARLRRRHVSLFFPAALPIDREVEPRLRRCIRQVIQPIDFRLRIRQAPTSAHDPIEALGLFLVQRDQHGHDRVPCVGSCRDDHVPANLAMKAVPQARGDGHVLAIDLHRVRGDGSVEDGDVLCEGRDQQRGIDLGEPLGRDGGARFEEHPRSSTASGSNAFSVSRPYWM